MHISRQFIFSLNFLIFAIELKRNKYFTGGIWLLKSRHKRLFTLQQNAQKFNERRKELKMFIYRKQQIINNKTNLLLLLFLMKYSFKINSHIY